VWQIVGQLHTGDSKAFLDESGNLGDQDVGRLPAAVDKWDELVTVSDDGKHSVNFQPRTTSYIPLRSLQGMYLNI
jgi:hypothetical protein